ncbi:hypothetical protein FACS1894201_04430 [Bacteroidia bacterium]|nr:hypothetical protein FACS1894201_04430 [Bacteroidia bacterium]
MYGDESYDDINGLFDTEVIANVKRFEDYLQGKDTMFFDVDEIVDLIDFYIMNDNFVNAQKALDLGIQYNAEHFDLNLKKAQILANTRQKKEALKLLRRLEQLNPNNTDVFFTRGTVYSAAGDSENAIAEYQKTLDCSHDEEDIDNAENIYFNLGIEYRRIGNTHKALQYFEEVLRINPSNDIVLSDIVDMYGLCEEWDRGIAFFQSLIEEDAFCYEAWTYLGMCYKATSLYEKALECVNYALSIDDRYDVALIGKAFLLCLLNDYRKAIDIAGEVLKIYPDNIGIRYVMAECYRKLLLFEEETFYLQEIVRITPSEIRAWSELIIAHLNTDRTEDAKNLLQEATSHIPDFPTLFLNYGDLLAEHYGRSDKGLQQMYTDLERMYSVVDISKFTIDAHLAAKGSNPNLLLNLWLWQQS